MFIPHKWVLSEKTLLMSSKDFDYWINSVSKAKQPQKERYYREYARFQKISRIIEVKEVNYNEYRQKEAWNYARKVIYVSKALDLYVMKGRRYQTDIFFVRRVFNRLYEYRERTSAMIFSVKYHLFVHGRVQAEDRYGSSKIHPNDEFEQAWQGLEGCIRSIVNSQSVDGILIKRSAIKFYYKKRAKVAQ